jgi:hypothetical protein
MPRCGTARRRAEQKDKRMLRLRKVFAAETAEFRVRGPLGDSRRQTRILR